MKIGELSDKVELSTNTIRYYEKMGFLQQPAKDQSGHRVYDHDHVELVNWITFLKKSGMPLDNIKIYSRARHRNEVDLQSSILEQHLEMLKGLHVETSHYIDITTKKIESLKIA